MTGSGLPLLLLQDLDAPVAWRQGRAIAAGAFIAEAAALARTLPAQGCPINLCQDRYLFALALVAALLREQTTSMPPNALPQTLRQVPNSGAPPYILTDDEAGASAPWPVIRVQRPAALPPARSVPALAAELEAVCLLTSGSTGAPQPHAKRWGTLVLNIRAEAARLAELMDRPSIEGLSLVATVPPQHSYGLESSVLLALLGGAAFDAGRPFYPADIADALVALPRPRALVTTPFHLKTLLRAGLALPEVDLVLSATAPLSPQLAREAEHALQGRLVEIYGCTEAGQVASRRTSAGDIWRTLGELRVERAAAPDGDERFVVSGGHVAEPTPLADVLDLEDENHFRLLGRANDLIHVAGKRSSLAHLNFQLNRIAGVEDGAFWLPDEAAEAVVRPIAFVVAPALTAGAIIAALREELEPAFVPRRVLQVDALPREATGKLTVAALRQFALERLGAVAADADGDADAAVEVPFTVARDHALWAGHFPGQPVLPGAVLIAFVMQATQSRASLRRRLGPAPCLQSAKFLHPVTPTAEPELQLLVRLCPQGSGVAFEVVHREITVASGLLRADGG